MPGSCRANRRAPSWSAGMTDQLLMGFVSHQAPSHQILLSRPRLPRHQGEAVRGFLLVLSVHDEDPKAQYPDGHSRAGVDPDHASTLSDRKEAARVSMVGGHGATTSGHDGSSHRHRWDEAGGGDRGGRWANPFPGRGPDGGRRGAGEGPGSDRPTDP